MKLLRQPVRPAPRKLPSNWGSAYGTVADPVVDHLTLPDLSDPDAFVAAAVRQINELNRRVSQQEDTLTAESRNRELLGERLERELERRTRELEEQASNVAIDGLRLQLVGWMLLFFGVLLSTALNIIAAG